MLVGKMVGRRKAGGRGRGGCSPETATTPSPSTLIPLSGLFDQQLTTGLCDTYRENTEDGLEVLRGRRGQVQVA
jgi:hypothetical protein